jgi:prepilin-type N-terminal cleavage/methylation domain-containing protein
MRRRAYSLLEVLLAVVILSVSAASLQFMAPMNAVGSAQASSDSRKLVAALRLCRSSAIANQADVRLRFLGSTQSITGFVVEQQVGGSFVPIAANESIGSLPVSITNTGSIIFRPNGASDVSLDVTLGTSRQRHRITVATANGQIRYVKN